MQLSNLFRLNWADVIKGLIMAVLSAILTAVYQALVAHTPVDIYTMLDVAEISGVAYIIKNFFSDSNGAPLGVKSLGAKNPSSNQY